MERKWEIDREGGCPPAKKGRNQSGQGLQRTGRASDQEKNASTFGGRTACSCSRGTYGHGHEEHHSVVNYTLLYASTSIN